MCLSICMCACKFEPVCVHIHVCMCVCALPLHSMAAAAQLCVPEPSQKALTCVCICVYLCVCVPYLCIVRLLLLSYASLSHHRKQLGASFTCVSHGFHEDLCVHVCMHRRSKKGLIMYMIYKTQSTKLSKVWKKWARALISSSPASVHARHTARAHMLKRERKRRTFSR